MTQENYNAEEETEELIRVGKLPKPLRLAAMLEKTMQGPLHGKAADCLREMYEALQCYEPQPQQEPAYRAVKTFHEGKPIYVTQPQQEPVAREPNDAELLKAFTRSNNGPNPFYRCNTCGDTEPGVREYLSNHWLKHNNTSPPQRPWQGLSDEEALECWPGLAMYADCVKFWENIEAKLKEKNDN